MPLKQQPNLFLSNSAVTSATERKMGEKRGGDHPLGKL